MLFHRKEFKILLARRTYCETRFLIYILFLATYSLEVRLSVCETFNSVLYTLVTFLLVIFKQFLCEFVGIFNIICTYNNNLKFLKQFIFCSERFNILFLSAYVNYVRHQLSTPVDSRY